MERLRAQTVFRTPLVRLGRFEAAPDEPLFSEVSPPGHHLVAFPETELAISYERAGRFIDCLRVAPSPPVILVAALVFVFASISLVPVVGAIRSLI